MNAIMHSPHESLAYAIVKTLADRNLSVERTPYVELIRAIERVILDHRDGWKEWAEHVTSSARQNLQDMRSEYDECRAVIRDLIDGMGMWGAEEDGIPQDLWPAYRRAHAAIGPDDPGDGSDPKDKI